MFLQEMTVSKFCEALFNNCFHFLKSELHNISLHAIIVFDKV